MDALSEKLPGPTGTWRWVILNNKGDKMEKVDAYTYFENKFDRLIYQNDTFFGVLVLIYLVCCILDVANWVPEASGFVTAIVVLLFAVSWIYTNARRRGVGRVKAGIFGLLTFFSVPLGGIIYFLLRPKDLVMTFLPPKRQIPFPVPIGDQAFIFFSTPFSFLLKLVFWMTGLTFFMIGVLSMLGKL